MTTHTYAGHTLAEIKAAAEVATTGPWQIVTDEHPHCRGGKHIERRIFTDWKHPQIGDFAPVVNGSIGIPAEKDGQPIRMVSIDQTNATHIATANPATVLAMAARIEELERDLRNLQIKNLQAKPLIMQIEGLELDAARYRWMVKNVMSGSIGFDDWWINADEPESEWDSAIDAAMEQSKNREGI